MFNRSLWLDEALLADNILTRNLRQLFAPLDHNQAAPFGFLLAEKVLGRWLGYSEYVLRAIPLVAGITSVILFLSIARRILAPRAVPIAISLFAIAPPLIYYSSELKQYSSDTAIGLLIVWLGLVIADSPLSKTNIGERDVCWNLKESLVF